MGFDMPPTAIGDALFTKTQQRVLSLLYGKPDKSFYTNEIVRRADMGRGTISRELVRLVSAGLLVVSRVGNQRHYRANPDNPVYNELVGIVRKTFGIADVIRAVLVPVDDQIDWAFVYGSIAKGEDTASSDIDLLVATESLAYADLMKVLTSAEQLLDRPVNPSIYTIEQIKNKLHDKNAFLSRLMEQPKLWVKGSKDDIGAIFDEYSSGPDEYCLERTVVPVRLALYEGERLISRPQAKSILNRVERFRYVILDFEGVDTIGQAFADEVFRVFANRHPEIRVMAANESEQISRMINRALSAS
jgi:predicted nucleotidyltransferase